MPAPRTPVATVQKPSKCGRKPKPATPSGIVVLERLRELQIKAIAWQHLDESAKALVDVTGVKMESGQVIETVPPCGLKWAVKFLNTGRMV